MQKDRGSFRAKDAAGREVQVYITQEMIPWGDRSGSGYGEGQMSMHTADGRHVQPNGPGRFLIVDGIDVELTSDDPRAPVEEA